MAIAEQHANTFDGVLKPQRGRLELFSWTDDPVSHTTLKNHDTFESLTLPKLPGGDTYKLHSDHAGHCYIEGPPRRTCWVQPKLRYATFTNTSGQVWFRDQVSGAGLWPETLRSASTPLTLGLSFGVPPVDHQLRLWAMPYTCSAICLWWSLPCIAAMLKCKKRGLTSNWVNGLLRSFINAIRYFSFPGTHHIRRSMLAGGMPGDPDRCLEEHSASTLGLLALVTRWAGCPANTGRLSEDKVANASQLLFGLCARGLVGHWAFNVFLDSGASWPDDGHPTGLHPARIVVDDDMVECAPFLEACARRASFIGPGRPHVMLGLGCRSIAELDLQANMKAASFLLGLASTPDAHAIAIWKQVVWHIGQRMDQQIGSELRSGPLSSPLQVPVHLREEHRLCSTEHFTTDYRISQKLLRVRLAIRAHFGKPRICSLTCDAGTCAKRSVMVALLADTRNSLGVLSPAVVPI